MQSYSILLTLLNKYILLNLKDDEKIEIEISNFK